MSPFVKVFVVCILAIQFNARSGHCSEVTVNPEDQPKVIDLSPRNGLSLVAVEGIKELVIKFNVDMNTKSFSVVTPCGDSGVCYKNGFWQNKRTLIIRLDRQLKHHHKYELGVGTKSAMYSDDGLHLEPIWWRFDTL